MSDSNRRVVPIWMIVLCWLVSIPIVIDMEYWWWIKLPVYLPFLVVSIGLLIHRPRRSA